jgi:hypothetical protein
MRFGLKSLLFVGAAVPPAIGGLWAVVHDPGIGRALVESAMFVVPAAVVGLLLLFLVTLSEGGR